MYQEYLHVIVAVSVFCIAILTALHILFSMQDESEWATFWLLLVLVLPVLGVILYLVAGISRKNTFGRRILHSMERFAREKGSPRKHGSFFRLWQKMKMFFSDPPADFARTEMMLENLLYPADSSASSRKGAGTLQDMLRSCSGNSIQLYCDGTEGYPAMLEAIRSAKKHIHLQSYIFANDPIGRAILAALRERAGAGVKVRVLFDKLGSFSSMWHLLRCRKAHLQIHPFSHSSLLTPWRFQLRNHRKLLIVDGHTAFTGGLNISYENVRTSRREGIHDYHCRVQGPAVNELQYAFFCDWLYSAGKHETDLDPALYFPDPVFHGNNRVRVMTSGHGYHFKGTENVFFTAAATARRSIWIITPYFVPGQDFSKALRMASARGVDIRLIVPETCDHWYVKMASSSYYETLLKDRVRVFERKGVFSHAKAMLVDSSWAYLGSSNCDSRSFHLNFELDLLISSGEFPETLQQQFLEEFKHCKEITLENLNTSRLRQLAEGLCALSGPVL